MELSENTGINEHAIKLIDGKLLLYRPIYALSVVELEILKMYIETHLKPGFIWPSKFFASTFIFFDKKPDKTFWLYVNYQGLNNLIIKNGYLFSLIRELLDHLG